MAEWISVKERLPKTDEYVIVAICDDSGDTEYRYTTFGIYFDMRFDGVWVVDNERNSGVTHWMPLPEPPREGG